MLHRIVNLSISTKVISLVVLIVLLFPGLILYYFLPVVERELLSYRKDSLRHLVELSVSLTEEYEQRTLQGEFSRQEAQKRAMTRIRQIRFGDFDYIWINDAGLPFPRMIMHPTIPDLDGRVLDDESFNCVMRMEYGLEGVVVDIPDRDKNLFQAFVKVVQQTGEGFVRYEWPRPTKEGVTPELYTKESYVRLFEPWGWVLGTGMYVDDVQARIAGMRRAIIGVTGGILSGVMIIAFFLVASITRPMKELMTYAEKVSRGDLNAGITGRFYAETGRLKNMITSMVGKLKQSISRAEQAALEARRAEEAMRESNSQLHAITDYAQDAIIMMDFDGNISFWNPAAEAIFGYPMEEAIGQNLHFLLAPERYHEAFLNAFPDFQNTGRGNAIGGPIELTARRKDGLEIPVSLSLSAIKLKGKWNSVGIVRDVTDFRHAEEEREKLQAQLFQAQKMESIGMLAGGIAHDFNNLLHAMGGNLELLDMKIPDDHPGKKRIQNIQKSMGRAAQLVRQMLLFSRKADVRTQVLDLNQEIHDVAQMLEQSIPRMISIELILDKNAWSINADPTQVGQVLLNLGTNAADAMPGGGRLIIETANAALDQDFVRTHTRAKPGKYVLMTVSDTGTGMDKETLQHVFEPFFTTKEVGKGTGLGLGSAYGIVKAHGGYITCYSEPGQGTTFKIYWPAAEQGEIEPVEKQTEQAVSQDGTETILVVDDDDQIRELTSEILEDSGYQVISAESGEQALEIFRKKAKDIDLVLMDLNMPGMGGSKCTRKMITLDPSVRVLVASGYSVNGHGKAAFEFGAKDFISKPFQADQLLAKVRQVLDT